MWSQPSIWEWTTSRTSPTSIEDHVIKDQSYFSTTSAIIQLLGNTRMKTEFKKKKKKYPSGPSGQSALLLHLQFPLRSSEESRFDVNHSGFSDIRKVTRETVISVRKRGAKRISVQLLFSKATKVDKVDEEIFSRCGNISRHWRFEVVDRQRFVEYLLAKLLEGFLFCRGCLSEPSGPMTSQRTSRCYILMWPRLIAACYGGHTGRVQKAV